MGPLKRLSGLAHCRRPNFGLISGGLPVDEYFFSPNFSFGTLRLSRAWPVPVRKSASRGANIARNSDEVVVCDSAGYRDLKSILAQVVADEPLMDSDLVYSKSFLLEITRA